MARRLAAGQIRRPYARPGAPVGLLQLILRVSASREYARKSPVRQPEVSILEIGMTCQSIATTAASLPESVGTYQTAP